MTSAHDHHHRPPHDLALLRSSLLEEGSAWDDVSVVEVTGSTNADLATAARAGAGATVLLAEHQTHGRGRLDRSWELPARAGLTMSMLMHTSFPASAWTWLPLLTGVAVCDAVRETSAVEATVKWPNDVLVGDRKLAGILSERVETPRGPAAVIGVGLNVSLGADELPVSTATSLVLEGSSADRDQVAVALARGVAAQLRRFEGAGGEASAGLRDEYVRRCSTIGATVTVTLPDRQELRGVAVGVDEHGRLVVRASGRDQVVAAGDVVHVRRGA